VDEDFDFKSYGRVAACLLPKSNEELLDYNFTDEDSVVGDMIYSTTKT